MLVGEGGISACFNYAGRKRRKREKKKRQGERINGEEGAYES